MIYQPNCETQEAETGYKELYIEPVSYILNDDSNTSLAPSKALVLGLLPLFSMGLFYSGVFDGQDNTTPKFLPTTTSNTKPSLIKPTIAKSSVGVVNAPESPLDVTAVFYKKPIVGARDFHQLPVQTPALFNSMVTSGRNAFAVKKELAKKIAIAMKKESLKTPLLLKKMQQQRVQLQQKTLLTKGQQKRKITFLENQAKVRLVSSRSSKRTVFARSAKKIIPMGEVKIRSRLRNSRGHLVKASYFVIQNGKRIQQQRKSSSALFKLPVGEYLIQAIYNGKIIEKKAIVEKAGMKQLTFVYEVKKQIISSKPSEKKALKMGKIVVMSHDNQGRGNVLQADYFVYKNGQEVLHKSRSLVTNFQLPVGDYLLRAMHYSRQGIAFIREMKVVVNENAAAFPIFVFNKEAYVPKKATVDISKQLDRALNAEDLKIVVGLVLHNASDNASVNTDGLEKSVQYIFPSGIGYSYKNKNL